MDQVTVFRIKQSNPIFVLKLLLTIILLLLFKTANAEPAHTYEIISRNGSFTWLTAYDSALSLGGYLAVINDQSEQDYIYSMLQEGDKVWLGGADLVEEGVWRWYTGETFEYTNWSVNQPSEVDGNDYIQMHQSLGGQWVADYTPISAFIVEYECCKKITGNVDCSSDNMITVSDVIIMMNYIFKDGDPPCCLNSSNTDGDQNQIVNIMDLTVVVDYLFKGGSEPTKCPPKFIPPPDTVILVDWTGKEWDISMGVHLYGLDTLNFHAGLGPDHFPPIWFPDFLIPGDSGYPAPESNFSVLGVIIDQEVRAYKLKSMLGHEVVNDIFFDSVEVAATY